jgi:hypothetical protein
MDSCVKELLLGIKTFENSLTRQGKKSIYSSNRAFVNKRAFPFSSIRICTLFSELTHKLLPIIGQEEDKNNHLQLKERNREFPESSLVEVRLPKSLHFLFQKVIVYLILSFNS